MRGPKRFLIYGQLIPTCCLCGILCNTIALLITIAESVLSVRKTLLCTKLDEPDAFLLILGIAIVAIEQPPSKEQLC